MLHDCSQEETTQYLTLFVRFLVVLFFKSTTSAWHFEQLYTVYQDGLSILAMGMKQLPQLLKTGDVCLDLFFCDSLNTAF